MRLSIPLTLSAILLIGSTLAAAATPLAPHNPAVPSANLVEKTHAWHRYCEWGPFRFHRHIRGIGNVRCRRHRRRHVRRYDYRYDRYARRNARRCDAWHYECKARWGKRNWRFNRCMVRHQC